MGSYGIIIKTEEIRRRVQNGDYDSAQKILDTIQLKKVKNIADLSLFADIFIHNERYDEAMDLLYRVYKKSRNRRVLDQMVVAAIGRKNIAEAEQFLNEYREIAPNDYNYYIYRYKIDKLKKEPYDVLINSLKKLKEHIYLEKWTYELAKLYYKAGMEKECIQECSEIILMFGEGSYVEKAKILKAYYSGEVNKDEIIQKLKSRANKEQKDDFEYEGRNGEIIDTDNLNIVNEKSEDSSIYVDYEAENELSSGQLSVESKATTEDEIDDHVLSEITDNMRKEVDSLLDNYDKIEKDTDYEQADVQKEIEALFELNETNEDLSRLDNLSERLNVNLRYLFGNFIHIKDLQKQLADSLELIIDNNHNMQMIITGEPLSGKTTLAKEIAIFLSKAGKLGSSKLLKISAQKLTETDITERKEELRKCCLLIERAGELKRPAIEKVLELAEILSGDIAVIFEDSNENINNLFRECPKIIESINNRIHIPPYSEDDLMRFAYAGIALRGYKLHPSALVPLKNGLYNIINVEDKDKRFEKFSEYIRNAIAAADLRIGTEIPRHEAEEMVADTEYLTLLPEDFTMHIIS